MRRDESEHKLFQKELLKFADAERRRIGQELDDGMGQQLAGLAFMSEALMEALREHSSPEVKLAETLRDSIQRLLGQVRTEAWGLIPMEIEARELTTALSGLATQISERFSVECQFICEEPVSVEKNITATNLYRIAQEAVTNAIKHGHASHIFIRLGGNKIQIVLHIQDDGIGPQKQTSANAGLGLKIMRYRAGLMNGKLDIQPVEGGGMRATCTIKGKDR